MFAVRILRRLIGRFLGTQTQPRPAGYAGSSTHPPPPSGGELVQDPVCGVYVATTSQFRQTVGGKTYCFCSEACRQKFKG